MDGTESERRNPMRKVVIRLPDHWWSSNRMYSYYFGTGPWNMYEY